MHELTIQELDAQLAEQLPARELMGRPSSGSRVTIVQGNSDNGNYSFQWGALNVNNVGNGDHNWNFAFV